MMTERDLTLTLLCMLIYVMLYCSNVCKAKKESLQHEEVSNLFSAAIKKAITRELSCYCWRWTHGEETHQFIKQLVLNMAGRTDSGGNFLFNDRIVIIWEEEKEAYCLHTRSGGSHIVHHHRAHHQGRSRATSASVCQRYHLIGILPSSPGQVAINIM